MKDFNDFVIDFQKFRKSMKIPYGFNESLKYIWTIPELAANQWSKELDNSGYEEDIINCYHDSFNPGNSILGIHTNMSYSNNPNVATLYEITEARHNFSVNDIFYESSTKVTNNSSKKVATDNVELTLPYLIKPKTFQFSDNRLYESTISGTKGLICSLYFVAGTANNNKLGNVSTFGTIDYKSGQVSITRVKDQNENYANQNYEIAKSWEEYNINKTGKLPVNYIHDSLSGSFIEFTTPITPIYAFNIN